MNRAEAYPFLSTELAAYKELSNADLTKLVGDRQSTTHRGSSGAIYVVEIAIRRSMRDVNRILVSGSVGPANWGSNHDRIDESFERAWDS